MKRGEDVGTFSLDMVGSCVEVSEARWVMIGGPGKLGCGRMRRLLPHVHGYCSCLTRRADAAAFTPVSSGLIRVEMLGARDPKTNWIGSSTGLGSVVSALGGFVCVLCDERQLYLTVAQCLIFDVRQAGLFARAACHHGAQSTISSIARAIDGFGARKQMVLELTKCLSMRLSDWSLEHYRLGQIVLGISCLASECFEIPVQFALSGHHGMRRKVWIMEADSLVIISNSISKSFISVLQISAHVE